MIPENAAKKLGPAGQSESFAKAIRRLESVVQQAIDRWDLDSGDEHYPYVLLNSRKDSGLEVSLKL